MHARFLVLALAALTLVAPAGLASYPTTAPGGYAIKGTVYLVDVDGTETTARSGEVHLQGVSGQEVYLVSPIEEQGMYRFDGLAAGDYEVMVGVSPHPKVRQVVTIPDDDGYLDFRVKTDPSLIERFHGIVVNGADRSPLENVLLYVYGGPEEMKVMSGPGGYFEFQYASDYASVSIDHEGYLSYHGRLFTPPDNNTLVLSPLPERVEVSGRVFDTEGTPLEGALVNGEVNTFSEIPPYEVYDMERSYGFDYGRHLRPSREYGSDFNRAMTDAEGAFSFTLRAGEAYLTATKEGYTSETTSMQLSSNNNQSDFHLAKMPDKSATVSGRVLDDVTGQSAGLRNIRWTDLKWGDGGAEDVGEDGSFSFQTRPGYIQIWANPWDQFTCHPDMAFPEIPPMPPMPPMPESRTVDYEDAVEPTYGYVVPATIERHMMFPECRPFDQATQDKIDQYHPRSVTVTPKDGEQVRVDLRLVKRATPSIPIEGWAVDKEQEKGVPGAFIEINNLDTGHYGSIHADEDGSYRVLAYPGYHSATVYSDGYLPVTTHFIVAPPALHDVLESLPGTAQRMDFFLVPGSPFGSDGGSMGPWYAGMPNVHVDRARPVYADIGGTYAPMAATITCSYDECGRDSYFGVDDGQESAYSGSGGGLGSYRKSNSGIQGDDASALPSAGLALLLVGVAAVLLVRRRA